MRTQAYPSYGKGIGDSYEETIIFLIIRSTDRKCRMSVNTTATLGSFKSTIGAVDTTSSCVFWLTGNSGDQEFVSEQPSADPISAYIKVKTENIGYGEITKTDESSGVKLAGAVYGIYSDSGCTNLVGKMTTDSNGYAKSKALVAGTYYVKEITAPKGYVLSGKVHTLTVKAGQTTGIKATNKEQLGSITIYKEGEVLVGWNGSNFTYETRKLPGATFKVTAGADIYKADGTKVYNKGDVIAENLVSGSDGQAVLSDLHLGTYVVKSKGFVWLDYFTEHQNIEKLTREVVVSLIREIKVFDKNHIEVIFDFDDCYKECLDVIESQGHFVEVDSMGKLNIRLKEAV